MTEVAIYLFRHGETEWNAENKRQGQLDSPLTETGKLQALRNARGLKKQRELNGPVVMYCSPLGRAKKTAEIIVDELGLLKDAIQYDDRLMESSFGEWEGLTDQQIAQQFPASWQARTADRWGVRPPSGESYADVHERVAEWYVSASLGATTLIFCHGLTSRVFRGIYAGLTHAQIFALPEPHEGCFELANGEISYLA
ncbi:MAG: histidine phosphatase family protein [Roseobacter sp.]